VVCCLIGVSPYSPLWKGDVPLRQVPAAGPPEFIPINTQVSCTVFLVISVAGCKLRITNIIRLLVILIAMLQNS